MIQASEIRQWIEAGIPGATVTVSGDDGAHFEAIVVAEAFAGKNLLARHRMVYEALGNKMQQAIHALSLKTYTPAEIH